MREGSTTEDYRNACSGEGEFGSLGYEWSDKPHRLVYDLCGEIEDLRRQIAEIRTALAAKEQECILLSACLRKCEAALIPEQDT
jgi:hypothetical protein